MKIEKINKNMFIDNLRRNLKQSKNIKRTTEFSPHNSPSLHQEKVEPEEETTFFDENDPELFFHWQALEYEKFERGTKWYITAILVLIAIIGWAIYIKSVIMSLVFVLIGIIGYIQLRKEPMILDFMITGDGIVAGKEIYVFADLKSFWIFYEPQGIKAISLHTRSSFMPYVQIPLAQEDPVEIRKLLLEYIPEKKHELGITDIFERVLKI